VQWPRTGDYDGKGQCQHKNDLLFGENSEINGSKNPPGLSGPNEEFIKDILNLIEESN
jgi:hypothetical protein